MDLADYDEESDGFLFRRTRSKKAKAAAAVKESEAIPETVQEEEPKPVSTRKTRKKSSEAPNAVVIDQDSKSEKPERRRRSARNSGEQIVAEPPPVQVKKRRAKQKDPSTPAPESQPTPDERPLQQEAPHESSGIQNEEATKVALPFADTPIIRRNKEMRANSGQRRSSLGNRGRRASSLIDSGKSNGMTYFQAFNHIANGFQQCLTPKSKHANSIDTSKAACPNPGECGSSLHGVVREHLKTSHLSMQRTARPG